MNDDELREATLHAYNGGFQIGETVQLKGNSLTMVVYERVAVPGVAYGYLAAIRCIWLTPDGELRTGDIPVVALKKAE